jgi:hypothetical protein
VPTGYAAYQPAAAPAKRMPVGLLVGGIGLVLVILVVGGVGASSILSKPAPVPVMPALPTPAASAAVVSPSAPPVASAPVASAQPVATQPVATPPVATPPLVAVSTPVPQPSAAPTAGSTAPPVVGGEVVSVANLSVTVSGPWTVADKQDYSIQLVIPQKGAMAFTSGNLKDPVTPEAWIASTLADDQKTDPNANYCAGTPAPESVTVPNGPPGLIAAMCYTATPQGGQAMKLVEIQMVGVDQAGTTVFIIDILAAEENISTVLDAASPLMSTVVWTLYNQG